MNKFQHASELSFEFRQELDRRIDGIDSGDRKTIKRDMAMGNLATKYGLPVIL